MTRVLFLDTETSGLPRDGAPIEFSGNPLPLEVACILCAEDHESAKRNTYSAYLGWDPLPPIETMAFRTHGIDGAVLDVLGQPPLGVVKKFLRDLDAADLLVGHNILFDVKIMQIAAYRCDPNGALLAELNQLLEETEVRCTLKMATPILRLPPTPRMQAAGLGNAFKSPNLGEAYRFFFSRDFTGAHGALADCLAARDLYYAIRAHVRATAERGRANVQED